MLLRGRVALFHRGFTEERFLPCIILPFHGRRQKEFASTAQS